MKNKYWILLFGAVLAMCLALVLIPADDTPARSAQIRSEDSVVIVDLLQPQTLVFDSHGGGYNIVTVQDGKIAVTEANCPDQICVNHKPTNQTADPIVCLPNKLVVEVSAPNSENQLDGVS